LSGDLLYECYQGTAYGITIWGCENIEEVNTRFIVFHEKFIIFLLWKDLTFLNFRLLVTRHLKYTEKRPMSIFRMCGIRPKKNLAI